ncbi:MAG: DUF3987 domain-containing protein [Sphingomonadales bacterium]|nr:DUF3987 domain-containing protein [Sphingomonadales bacterium]
MMASVNARIDQAPIIDIWPEPQPIQSTLPSVLAFDIGMLPNPLHAWVQDISDRMQAPIEYVAVSAMIAAGTLIGRKVGIRPQENTDWVEVPNFWGCIIGRPGVLKSPSMKAALAPLYRIAERERELFQAKHDEWADREIEREMRADAFKKAVKGRLRDNPGASLADLTAADDPEPQLTRYVANDTSYQSLAELLRTGAPNGILAFRDELMSLIKGLDNEANVEARGFYLSGWNGTEAYTFDRIGRGFNLHIPAVTISLFGSTQPGRICEYVSNVLAGGAGDDGLIQRFGFMVWPDMPANWKDIDREPDAYARGQAFAAYDCLAALDPAQMGASSDNYGGPPYLRFDEEAQAEFRQWRTNLEGRLRNGDMHPTLESHIAKYRKLIPTIALVHHLMEIGSGPVGLLSVLAAMAWGEFLESHALRVYGAAADISGDGARTIIRNIKKGELSSPFTIRELKRKGWSGLTDEAHVMRALELLEEHHFLRVKPVETGGRRSPQVIINPKVLGQ